MNHGINRWKLRKGLKTMYKKHTGGIRSTGDCKRAKGHITRCMYFDSIGEAQDLLEKFCQAFTFTRTPRLRFMNRKTKRRNGDVNPLTGLIRMFPMGQRVSTLIHELAHLNVPPYVQSHGKEFKAAQDKLLKYWEKNLDPKKKKLTPDFVKFAYSTPEPVVETYKTESGFTTTRTTY